jgi:hypothetical protein
MATKPGALTEYPWTNFGAWKVSSQLRLLDSTQRKLLLPSIDPHFGLPCLGKEVRARLGKGEHFLANFVNRFNA